MGEEITVYVGDLYANQHAQLSEALGEQYDQQLRTVVEDTIHDVTKNVERQSELQDGGPDE